MTSPVQTSGYKSPPSRAYPGLLHDGPHDIGSVCCDEPAGIAPGLLVVRTSGGDYAAGLPAFPVLDVDGIYTSHAASAGGPQNLTSADWDGVLAGTKFPVPRRLTVTLNSHANWDATTGSITFLDQDGVPVTESLAIPDGGNATLTTTAFASAPPSAVTIPQQSGAGATYQIGVNAQTTLDGGHVLGVSVREHKGLGVTPSFDDNEVWEEGAEFGVVKDGKINVLMESAFRAGDHPWVRLSAGVGERLGAFRGNADGSDCLQFKRGRLRNSGSANEYAVLDILPL